MDILDYLETATRPITSPQEARDVRDELYDHYLRLVEAHLGAGETFDEACALALKALGPAHSIQPLESPARSSDPITTLLLVGAWLAAAFSFAHPIVFSSPWGLAEPRCSGNSIGSRLEHSFDAIPPWSPLQPSMDWSWELTRYGLQAPSVTGREWQPRVGPWEQS